MVKSPTDRDVQKKKKTHAASFAPLSICLCTDLCMQVDICNAVEGKLKAIAAIFIDVSDSQARQLLHCFVITGGWDWCTWHQCKTFTVHNW